MQEMKFRTVSREPRGRVGDWHKTTYRRGPLTLLYTRCAGSRWRLVVRYKSRPLGTRPYSAMPGCWTLAQGTRLTDLRKILRDNA